MLFGSKWTRALCAGACLLCGSLICNAHCQGLPPVPSSCPLASPVRPCILIIIPGVCPPPQLTVIAEAVTVPEMLHHSSQHLVRSVLWVLLGKRLPSSYSGTDGEIPPAVCLFVLLVNIAVLWCDVWGGGSHLAAKDKTAS